MLEFCRCHIQHKEVPIMQSNVHSNIPCQIVEAFEMMIVTILSAAVKCQWDLKPYQEAMITTVTLNLLQRKIVNHYFFRLYSLESCSVLQVGVSWLINVVGRRSVLFLFNTLCICDQICKSPSVIHIQFLYFSTTQLLHPAAY